MKLAVPLIRYNIRMRIGQQQIVDCYSMTDEDKRKSKGLLILAKELKTKVPANIKLDEVKRLLSLHKAFQNVRLFFGLSVDFLINLRFMIHYNF